MSTRYIVDAEGHPVEVILDLGDLRRMLEASKIAAEAAADLERVIREAARISNLAPDVEGYEEAVRAIEDAQRAFAISVGYSIGQLEELEEDREAIRALDEDTERIERGEAELIPWEESKRRRR